MIKSFHLRWTLNCAAGELLGIGFAGLLAFLANTTFGEPESLFAKLNVLLLMLMAGFIEGSLLGYFQWRVLKEKFSKLPMRVWMEWTIAVAVLGWFLGMLPSLFFIPANPDPSMQSGGIDFDNPWIFVLLSVSMGLILGAVFGLFQWFALRKYAEKAEVWILANALGWGVGLGWIFLFASLPDENSGIFFTVFVGAIGGILAGLSIGAITGLFLLRIKKREPFVGHFSYTPNR